MIMKEKCQKKNSKLPMKLKSTKICNRLLFILRYKQNLEKLKDLKSEIENIQFMIQKNQEKLQKDFENWL